MKNKNFFSRFLIPTLVVGIFGVFAVGTNVLGQNDDTAATTTQINNVVPAWVSHTAESWIQSYAGTAETDARSESSATYPTNQGTTVLFTATADDVNNDNYYLIVCDSAGVTAHNNAAPTCTGTQICVSASTTDNTAATCSHDTTGESSSTYNWYSYVCDHNPASTCSAASNTSQTGTHAEAGTPGSAAGSPYHVNHKPTFSLSWIMADDESSIAPDDTVRVQTTANNDSDSDTVTLYVCSGEADQGGVTTAFDYDTNTCTGGTLLCSQSGVSVPGSAYCDDTTDIVNIPTAHATDYTVKLYMEDQHSYGTDVLSSDYEVADVPPVFSAYGTTGTVTLTAGDYKTLTRSVTYTDDNGDRDVIDLDTVFFEDTTVNDDCSADENDCYRIDSVDPTALGSSAPALGTEGCYTSTVGSAGTGKTLTGSDNIATVTCNHIIWFNATAGGNWEYSATPSDGSRSVNFADSEANTLINALSAISIAETTIAYGTVAVGGDSTYSASTTTTMENKGNQVIDVLLQGTDMSSGGYSIDSVQQNWHNDGADFTWGDMWAFALLNTAVAGGTCELGTSCDATHGCLNRNLSVRNDHELGAEDEDLAWKIRIPAAQESGSYTGTNTFTSTDIDDCVGAPDDKPAI